jgi:eukaryotic-like serine/threonine-protein kinase
MMAARQREAEAMVMRPAHCDPSRLERLFGEGLAEDGCRDLEDHLLVCAVCRERLDALAGGPPWWAEVRRHLGDANSNLARTSDQEGPEAGAGMALDFLSPSDSPGSLGRLGHYEVLEVLGRGGMSVVLKAFDPTLHRPVAVKVLAAEYAARGAARRRFAREARAAAAICHDHVVPVHAVDADATPPYLVMAYIPGQSLQQRLDRSGPLELKEVLRIGMQAAAGLAAAHVQGLVHRDIKPANIMLENGIERVKITDFGLARAVDDGSVTQGGAVAGTPQYMAPEQARGETVDQRADLFALGSTLYAMCTGRPPFRGESSMAILRQVCDAEPTPLRSINPDVPAWLEGIIRNLHAKEPAQRFQSAAEVAELLEGCLAHVQQPDRHDLPRQAAQLGREIAQKRSRRRWATAAAAGLLAGGVACFLIFSGLQHPSGDGPGLPGQDVGVAIPGGIVDGADGFAEGSTRLRAGMERFRHGVAAEASQDTTALGMELGGLQERTSALRGELGLGTESDGDLVQARLDEIRRRLEVLKRRAVVLGD